MYNNGFGFNGFPLGGGCDTCCVPVRNNPVPG